MSKKISLVVLAAGMGSRYGGLKQIEKFGTSGETLMEYSIYDAIKNGFEKIVFVIKKDFKDEFIKRTNHILPSHIEVAYIYQELTTCVPASITSVKQRTKPWGTAHALLCCKDIVQEPFATINADDFYGPDALKQAALFLKNECSTSTYAIIGYPILSTLSKFGPVSRGICDINSNNDLLDINERIEVFAKGKEVFYKEKEKDIALPKNAIASMNLFCFHHTIFPIALQGFHIFLDQSKDQPKAEYYLATLAKEYMKNNTHIIKVIPTQSQWFGVTYKTDAIVVKNMLQQLIKEGIYPSCLWNK